jgi:hypothetical protein
VFHSGEERDWQENKKRAFREHNENVRKLTKERGKEVLDYEVKEG